MNSIRYKLVDERRETFESARPFRDEYSKVHGLALSLPFRDRLTQHFRAIG